MPQHPRRADRRATLLLVGFGTFMAALDASIVNVSVPAIMADYDAGIDAVEWVVSAYMIAFAALMPLTAWARDKIGNAKLYVAALATFTIASALCGLAPSLETLIAARVLQALGGGAINPTGMAMLAEVFPKEERGRALGWWGLVAVLGPAAGPTIGGLLTENWGWRWIFLVNVPVGILLLVYARYTLARGEKPQPAAASGFPWMSFLSLVAGIVSLLYATSRLPRTGFGSQAVIAALAIGAVCLSLFVADWHRRQSAVLDLNLLKVATYRRALAITVVRSMALFGTTFLVPLFLQGPRGLSETSAGLILGPGALAIGLTMPIAGRLLPRLGTRLLTTSGVALLFLYCVACAFWDEATPTWMLVATLITRGFGIGLLVTPIATLALNAVDEAKVGMASSMMNLTQQMAGALGVALFAGVYDAFLATASPVQAFERTFLGAAALIALTLPIALRLPSRDVQSAPRADLDIEPS